MKVSKESWLGLFLGIIVLGIVLAVGSQPIAWVVGIIYAAAVLGLFKLVGLSQTDKFIPVNIFSFLIAVILIMFAATGFAGAKMPDVGFPELDTGATGIGDVVLHPNYGYNSSDFAESGSFYLLKNGLYADQYEMLQVFVDESSSGLIGPDGKIAQKTTVSSGDVTFKDIEAFSGEQLTIGYIYDSTPASGEWPAMLWTDVTVAAIDDDDSDNNHKLSGSVVDMWRMGALDSYDWENTDRAGYKYDATTTTAESNKQISFDSRPTTAGDECRDVYYFVETDANSDANIDHIEIAGTVYTFGSWIDIGDASSTWTGVKESKQATANNLYAVAQVPLQRYVSSTVGTPDSYGNAEITIQYDVPSMADNTSMLTYVYGVPQGAGGSDMHYSAAANPLFVHNASTESSLTESTFY